jgi:hypothetical protein
MKIGADSISLRLGSVEIPKAYLGSELVYSKELPYDAAIEYIGTTGTQYIDTGIIQSTTNFELTLVAQWTGNASSDFEAFFGYSNTPGSSVPRFQLFKYNGKWTFGTNSTSISDISVDNNKHTFFVTGNASTNVETMSVDGGTATNGTSSSEGLQGNTIHQYLGGRSNNDGTLGRPSSARFYYLNYKKFADAGHTILTQEWNLIPVRIGQVGYMYDTVSGQLLGNSGSGNFVLGNDLTT